MRLNEPILSIYDGKIANNARILVGAKNCPLKCFRSCRTVNDCERRERISMKYCLISTAAMVSSTAGWILRHMHVGPKSDKNCLKSIDQLHKSPSSPWILRWQNMPLDTIHYRQTAKSCSIWTDAVWIECAVCANCITCGTRWTRAVQSNCTQWAIEVHAPLVADCHATFSGTHASNSTLCYLIMQFRARVLFLWKPLARAGESPRSP